MICNLTSFLSLNGHAEPPQMLLALSLFKFISRVIARVYFDAFHNCLSFCCRPRLAVCREFLSRHLLHSSLIAAVSVSKTSGLFLYGKAVTFSISPGNVSLLINPSTGPSFWYLPFLTQKSFELIHVSTLNYIILRPHISYASIL